MAGLSSDLSFSDLESLRSAIVELEEYRHSLEGEDLAEAEGLALSLREVERLLIGRMQKRVGDMMTDDGERLKAVAADVRQRVSRMTSSVKFAEGIKKVLDVVSTLLEALV